MLEHVSRVEWFGVGRDDWRRKGTVTLADFDRAEAIFVIGQNPGTNHPRMLSALEHAKRNGCKLVHINPLPEVGMTRFKHPQHVLGMLGSGTGFRIVFAGANQRRRRAVERNLESGTGATAHSIRISFRVTPSGSKNSPRHCRLFRGTTLSNKAECREQIDQAAQIFIESERTIFCWAMGLTQHRNAVANIQEIVNLMLLRGQVGQPGAGLCPVRGHSNVQGDRTMGIWERPVPAFLDRLGAEFDFDRHAITVSTLRSIHAMHDGQARVFFALGGNFLSATPDTEFTAAALRRCRLTAHVSTN